MVRRGAIFILDNGYGAIFMYLAVLIINIGITIDQHFLLLNILIRSSVCSRKNNR
jgi:hypothetical protein